MFTFVMLSQVLMAHKVTATAQYLQISIT